MIHRVFLVHDLVSDTSRGNSNSFCAWQINMTEGRADEWRSGLYSLSQVTEALSSKAKLWMGDH